MELCQISKLTDIDINQNLNILTHLGINGFILPWYSDKSYSNDDYGCKTLPKIFHLWLLCIDELNGQTPPNVPHINILGDECTDRWMWGNTLSTIRNGRKIIIIAGGTYKTASDIIPEITIVDITDLNNIKIIADVKSKNDATHPFYVGYDPVNDVIVYVASDNKLYIVKFDDMVSRDTLEGDDSVKSYNSFCSLQIIRDSKAVIMCSDSVDIIDLSSKSVSANISGEYARIVQGAKYVVGIKWDENKNFVGHDIIDIDEGKIVKSISWSKSVPSPTPYWAFGLDVIGDNILLIANDKLYVIDVNDGTVNSYDMSDVPPAPTSPVPINYGNIIILEKSSNQFTDGKIYYNDIERYVDAYKIKIENDEVEVIDKNGNKVSNANIYICKLVEGGLQGRTLYDCKQYTGSAKLSLNEPVRIEVIA